MSQDTSQSDVVAMEPEYCPEAAVDWYRFGYELRFRSKMKREDIEQMTMKAKKHLLALGWSFRYRIRNGKRELQYCSPGGKCYNSLRTACMGSINERDPRICDSASTHFERKTVSKIAEGQSTSEKIPTALNKMQFYLENSSSMTSCMSMLRKIEKKGKEKSYPACYLHQQKANADGH